MARVGRAAALALLVLCISAVAVSAKKEHVKVLLGQTEFEEAIKENPFIVVEFYAPWCGHCKNLAPEWESAAKTLSESKLDPPIVLANLDATEEDNKPLATKYGVKGFPTIKIFRDGDLKSPLEYNGPRESAGIVSFLKKQAGPAFHSLRDASSVKDFVKLEEDKDVVVVGVFPDGDATEEAAEFKSAAQAMRDDFEFALVTDASLVPDAKGAKTATVLVYKNFDESPVTYDGALTKKDLSKWVNSVAYPPFAILDQVPKNRKVLQKIFEDPKPKVLVFVSKKDSSHDAIKEELTTISKAQREELNYIYVDPTGNDGALEYFGLKAKDTPAFVIHDQGKDAKYVSKNVAAGSLGRWLDEFKAGNLKKTIKSEDPPEPNDGPVTILTASNFDDIVQLGKNYMIEFYAPWCGHCKKLTPIYEKVGEAFKDDPTVVVAKMDATANDINDTKKFPVKGFPTLKFVTADGEVLDYSGDRSEEDLVKFIKGHADSKADDPTVRKDEL